MSRIITLASGQLGPIARDEGRQSVVRRLLDMMRQAHGMGAQVIVFPELALTTFFPRWYFEDEAELDSFYETEMPSEATRPLFEESEKLGMGFYLGYAELEGPPGARKRFNTAILVDRGRIIGKYRKIHLPGHADFRPQYPFQHLEKAYFDVGDLGFGAWEAFGGVAGMCICNDRRWPETYRMLGLQGAEMIFLGYNTPTHIPWEPIYDHLTSFHNHLSMQAGAYQNSAFVVGTAKGGVEEGSDLLASSCIIAPSGEIIALATTRDDEVIAARCDLDLSRHNKEHMFNFAQHRQIGHYGLITSTAGSVAPRQPL
ncbi:MAG: N-carbamoyl-D-amino-acid hydrolase [Azospirillaceae bacterium]